MTFDRRIYLATALAALVAGTAVVAATPHDPFAGAATIHGADDVSSTAAAPESIVLVREPADSPFRLVLVDGADSGVGVRAPATWPVDIRREMAAPEQVVGLLR